ncbi:MAG: HEAT repeat domain-containing protein [Acidobacteriaceae bacterium]|nr:HEAT repeat domain-containing protein [Acidobacteriaceae bacterium]
MAVRNVERELESLSALRHVEAGETRTQAIRRALHDRVNVIAAKAAALTAEFELKILVPELCATFERLLTDPLKTDPQCWGKDAVGKALKDLGHDDSAIFLKGVHHVQLEPVWGGQEDTAANVRSTCALALLQCTDLTREDKLWHVMPLLTERSPSLRKDAAAALESLEGREAALLLRIKARMGDEDATVTGQVLESLLRVERDAAVPFVIEFLRSLQPEVREEAALALGASRLATAVAALKNAFGDRHRLLDSEILCRALSISRNEEAIDFLLEVLRTGRLNDAQAALDALTLYRDSMEVRSKIGQAVANRTEAEIKREFKRAFEPR